MKRQTREYVQAAVLVVLIALLLFLFDLPKTPLLTLLIVVPAVILFEKLFPRRKKPGVLQEVTGNLVLLALACLVIWLFDLPAKLYLFMAVLFISNALLSLLLGRKESSDEGGRQN